ncbi:hypothetical protein E2562_028104 [Oryza meyeriana var. granulata]|uniref:Uncharacterized protein n=1 Tax=Oryza meyeriana var. granulata TaxID=110450 RepID=A0A6G1C9N9_9ORYZ|nr:hypothetical protein E2562_028104 [Oryza meyeriana var. granulata]
MADLAVGSVTKLLGLIHNEAQLLGRVKGDVQFIKEEMESINSFLARLARTAPDADGQDDEQIRTWMKQVRDLARDCSTCIDSYVQSGDPKLQRARGGTLRYLWKVYWFAQMLYTQYKAADELRKLKERARDVSERRSRYDVKVPEKKEMGGGPKPPFLEDHCAEKLSAWLKLQEHQDETKRWTIPSTAIVAPYEDNSGDMALEVLGLVPIHFDRRVRINLQQVHGSWDLPLLPQELLCYILQKCELEDKGETVELDHISRACTYRYDKMCHIQEMISAIQDYDKIEEINSKIEKLETNWSKYISDKRFAMLYQALKALQIGPGMNMPSLTREEIVLDAAWMLKDHMESVEPEPPILLDITQYEAILQKVFLTSNKEASTSSPPPPALGEDVIKEIIHIVRELLPKPHLSESNNSENERQAAGTTGMNDATAAAEIMEAKQKIYEVYGEFRYQLLIKGIADKINKYLKDKKTLIVLQDDGDYISQWEEIRNALNLIGCTLGSAVIVTTKKYQRAKEFCYPPGEPITYSLVGLYHDIVLELTREKRKKQDGSYDPQILRDILKRCYPYVFAMKVFIRDLYANPNRSIEDLRKLLDNLDSLKSLEGASNSNIANMTMLKFSCSTLPKEYKTCLVYLAIFSPGHKIKRSTLVGRWVVEGLITKGDWPSAVRHGERCFDMLIDRWLVYPNDTDATGEVKNYIVGDLVHQFITKIAKKEYILDARLSHEWAHHFSVFSDLQLRASDSVNKLLWKLPKHSPQLQLLKVLDLEGCKFIKKLYLKNICRYIPLLKYLSLRGTNVTNLPHEINNLRELEILDIRQTEVHDTSDVLLLKLKRLLAGPVRDNELLCSTAQIPSRIEKMEHMEVLSNVMASRDGDELEHIRKLYRLRKLGVVIEDKEVHLKKFLRVISDLKDRIQTLSVTLQPTKRCKGTAHSGKQLLPEGIVRRLKESKRLEKLSINGVIDNKVLSFLTQGGDRLAKVNLTSTSLNQENLEGLAALPKLCCVRLQHVAYTKPPLTFKEHDFKYLKCFIVDDFLKTNIIDFEKGTAPELNKITLSFTDIKCLRGVGGLPKLKELVLKGNKFLLSLLKDEVAIDDEQCTACLLTFKKEEFQHLEYLLVDAHLSTDIIFEDGAAPQLRKVVLSLEKIMSLHGVSSLSRLTELDLDGNNKVVLLSLLKENAKRIAKVTLRNTLLNQDDLQVLAKKPNLHCLVLLDSSYNESKLTFKKDDFTKLTLLTVDCSAINNITFANGAAPNMEKITWTFSRMESLSGIKNLPKLNRLELFGGRVPYQVTEDIKALRVRLVYTHRSPQEQQINQNDEDDDIARSPFSCFTSKNWCTSADST